jgi:hypothetical protein
MSRNHEMCAARLPPPERAEFLALIAEASATAKRAWATYYRVTGASPRGKPLLKTPVAAPI